MVLEGWLWIFMRLDFSCELGQNSKDCMKFCLSSVEKPMVKIDCKIESEF
jgi:hypothetical protein